MHWREHFKYYIVPTHILGKRKHFVTSVEDLVLRSFTPLRIYLWELWLYEIRRCIELFGENIIDGKWCVEAICILAQVINYHRKCTSYDLYPNYCYWQKIHVGNFSNIVSFYILYIFLLYSPSLCSWCMQCTGCNTFPISRKLSTIIWE